MTRRIGTLQAAAAVGLISLVVAGCSSNQGAPPTSGESVDAEGLPTGDSRQEQSVRATFTCLRDRGWAVSYDPRSGGMDVSTGEQGDAFARDAFECSAEFDALNPPPALTRERLGDLYEQSLETMRCLEEQGFPPLEQPPSREKFIDDELAQSEDGWTPYSAVGNVSGEAFNDLMQKCPEPGSSD